MAKSDNVKLLGHWACPYVNRVQLALKLKCVEYEFIQLNPHNRNEILLKNNPVYKKIPVLIHCDKPICESLLIVQYVDDSWATSGPSILPLDPYESAWARFWAAYIDDKWYPLIKMLREAEGHEERQLLIQKVSEGLVLLEEAFVKCSKDKAYFGGDNIGFVDIVLGSCLGWLKATEKVIETLLFDHTKTPVLSKWADRILSCDAVKDVFPDTDKLSEVYKMVQDYKNVSLALPK